MKELIDFFKEIFMIKSSDSKVGLSQFKAEEKVQEPVKKIAKIQKDVKLSDLMRQSA